MISPGKDRITVRIHNMKRSTDRETPPTRRKRAHSSMGRYDDSSDERITPDRVRHRSSRVRTPSPRGGAAAARYMSPHHDEYMRPPERSYPYKVLCVSALHPKASDEIIKDTLYREYKKFGDLSIRITHDIDERLAYVCFRNPEDARDAKYGKPRIIVYDKVAMVEPIYEVPKTSSEMYSRGRPRSISPGYDSRHYYARSPERLSVRAVDRYERGYGHPAPGIPIHREYRREAMPAPHHEYMVRPPIHHGPPHMGGGGGGGGSGSGAGYGYGPPRHSAPRGGGGGGVPYEKVENKKDKFPNYLHHIQPEDDPLATRTLFAGNLEINITEEELRRIFGRFGVVEDVDIKRPPPGTGNAFAFVRYHTLDMAHRAKVELSGQYIGKFQCKIGYGKATPTTRIWVGGLGTWTSITQLEREFDRFGAIKKIDYSKGDIQAYILYDSIDAAQAAVKEMRGFPLGGSDHRLRTDFSDVTPFKPKAYPANEDGSSGDYRRPPDEFEPGFEGEGGTSSNYGGGGSSSRYKSGGRAPYQDRRGSYKYPPNDGEEWSGGGGGGRTRNDYDRRRSGSRTRGGGGGGGVGAAAVDNNRSRSRSPRRSIDSDSDNGTKRAGLLASSRTLPEVARKCSTTWQGALILKNSLFPAKFHLIDGDSDIVDGLMKDEDGKHQLRITQRLRLDQPKLEDVQKRISSASSHAIFLGMAGSTTSVNNDDVNVQTRPLRNLVSYLKQKEAAGVISLLNKETEATGVLYSFPPCPFSTELLKRTCLNLPEDALKEDHLVIVVVRGGTA
ncbi:PREDICTED: putative RNA-binding protein 15B [Nicrophorus vespilloides]|uniref:RNA-binding protein 15B n=1 Tax=Nicrophorus vespilloides TaxID=110193 RepID=A0ABM1MBT5_NICVS|nr:PREDICTED: putative RNA-binding protein 15B [Nicrophorus vespilloides]XP_017772035.1 PREDICTED: putative RNA-binding protein 15B [Nicrophorus vespilloides]